MDRIKTGEAPYRVHPPIGSPASVDPFGPSDSRTPLGEPIDKLSAFHLAYDPLTWHLNYWLSLEVVGVLRGEDPMLMALRVEREMLCLPDQELKAALHTARKPHWKTYKEESERHWPRMTLWSDECKSLARDINRMLEYKSQKTREYLLYMEILITGPLRAGRVDEAREVFDKHCLIYQKLELEEDVEREAAKYQNRFKLLEEALKTFPSPERKVKS